MQCSCQGFVQLLWGWVPGHTHNRPSSHCSQEICWLCTRWQPPPIGQHLIDHEMSAPPPVVSPATRQICKSVYVSREDTSALEVLSKALGLSACLSLHVPMQTTYRRVLANVRHVCLACRQCDGAGIEGHNV